MKRKAYNENIELYLQNPSLITIAGSRLSYTIHRAVLYLLIALFLFVYSVSPAEGLKGTGYLTPPPFVTLTMVKRVARALSIFLIFVWAFVSTSVTIQTQFLKDIESTLLRRAKDSRKGQLP